MSDQPTHHPVVPRAPAESPHSPPVTEPPPPPAPAPREVPPGLDTKLDRLLRQLDLAQQLDYRGVLELIQRPFWLFWTNLLVGIARGVGMAVGFAIVGSIIVVLTRYLLAGVLDIPVIGTFVADIIEEVQHAMQEGRR